MWWAIVGFIGGLTIDLITIIYLAVGLRRHADYDTSRKEMGTVLGTFIGSQAVLGFFGLYYMWDMALYMQPRTLKALYDRKGNSMGSGIAYDY